MAMNDHYFPLPSVISDIANATRDDESRVIDVQALDIASTNLETGKYEDKKYGMDTVEEWKKYLYPNGPLRGSPETYLEIHSMHMWLNRWWTYPDEASDADPVPYWWLDPDSVHSQLVRATASWSALSLITMRLVRRAFASSELPSRRPPDFARRIEPSLGSRYQVKAY